MTKGKMRGRRPVNKNFLAAMIQNGLQGNFFLFKLQRIYAFLSSQFIAT